MITFESYLRSISQLMSGCATDTQIELLNKYFKDELIQFQIGQVGDYIFMYDIANKEQHMYLTQLQVFQLFNIYKDLIIDEIVYNFKYLELLPFSWGIVFHKIYSLSERVKYHNNGKYFATYKNNAVLQDTFGKR